MIWINFFIKSSKLVKTFEIGLNGFEKLISLGIQFNVVDVELIDFFNDVINSLLVYSI